jgi:hypothetical protein
MTVQATSPVTTDDVNQVFSHCKKNLRNDRMAVNALMQRADLKTALARYMVEQRLDDDDLILYNWFIGSTFHTSVNELKKLH